MARQDTLDLTGCLIEAGWNAVVVSYRCRRWVYYAGRWARHRQPVEPVLIVRGEVLRPGRRAHWDQRLAVMIEQVRSVIQLIEPQRRRQLLGQQEPPSSRGSPGR